MVAFLWLTSLALLAVGGRAAFVILRERVRADQARWTAESHERREVRLAEADRGLAERALESRKLDLKERALVVEEQRLKSPNLPTTIPPDLVRRIFRWESPDAQDAERKILLDLYYEFRDCPDPWVEVRGHLVGAPDDEMPDDISRSAMGGMVS
jgi:hypothetical protein